MLSVTFEQVLSLSCSLGGGSVQTHALGALFSWPWFVLFVSLMSRSMAYGLALAFWSALN